jgi:DNA topoisomerase III
LEPIGKCPKCGSNVYDTGMAYICEKATGPSKTCDFRSGKVILQREIPREQMVKLLTAGKTDLLPKFISKKGRPFSAYLVSGKDGKVSFEFEPRKPKVPKKGSKAAPEKPIEPSPEPAGTA